MFGLPTTKSFGFPYVKSRPASCELAFCEDVNSWDIAKVGVWPED
jgi:hypothetical protein